MLPIIRQILVDDTKAPKKHRHTAHRIWQRLRDEHGFTGSYTVINDAVREMRVGGVGEGFGIKVTTQEFSIDARFVHAKR